MLDEGFWAEIKVGEEHLHLFAERNALGVQASVYNVKSKRWIAPSELGNGYRGSTNKGGSTCEPLSAAHRGPRVADI
jgi:hypothetical protein